ncbi:hypothetical protein NC653_008719 [Populus alba x Populus x berolinensis]|uniref:Uncharacterized protein n=1 Tax=Populus alba x Populus x berolinensis TaxID=444605 RepID=A0AAD6R733_9ROSI|nr:hypothetical protein NC653_008719 [Populus alba x Populus x berolinensis]
MPFWSIQPGGPSSACQRKLKLPGILPQNHLICMLHNYNLPQEFVLLTATNTSHYLWYPFGCSHCT